MTRRTATILAWSLWLLSTMGGVAFVVIEAFGTASRSFSETFFGAGQEAFGAIAFSTVGLLLVARQYRNAIGWLFLAIGLSYSISAVGSAMTDTLAVRSAGWQWGSWLNTWSWVPGWFGMVTFLLMLFPDGGLPSPRWRWVAWTASFAIAVSVLGGALSPTSGDTPGYQSPLPTLSTTVSDAALLAGLACLAVAAIGSIAALIVRYRRSRGEERLQMEWFVYAAVVTIVLTPTRSVAVHQPLLLFLGLLSTLILPVAVGVAILKYRLYDIEVVIKKTLLALVLTILIGVPAILTLAIASQVLLWRGTGKVVTLVGGVLLGLCLLPLIRVARRVADRIVYGQRATAYEVMADFSERVGGTYASDDVLSRMAEISKAGTGATTATVWLLVDGALRPAATTDGDEVATDPDGPGTFRVEVRHHDELLGALSVTMPANDPLDPGREKLVRDLASQAGLVLRNVRLIEELKASRQRLVAAQDEERRKLERNLHDGAQQQLVALAVKQRLLGGLIGRDDPQAKAMVVQLAEDTNDALETLRDLARGIYPPLLQDKGLVSALEAQARKATVPTTVEGSGIGRFGQDIEAAVYFSCLEALQNVAKYADASSARIALSNGGGSLSFTVSDDGAGFDASATSYGTGLQGVADRLAALGGTLGVESVAGSGTVLTGTLPINGTWDTA
jgi:signal transduction histidine kinase